MGCAAAKRVSRGHCRQVTGTFLDVDHPYSGGQQRGTFMQDRQIRTRLMVSAVAEINGETQPADAARPSHGTGDV